MISVELQKSRIQTFNHLHDISNYGKISYSNAFFDKATSIQKVMYYVYRRKCLETWPS